MKSPKQNVVISKFQTIEDVDFYYRKLIAAMPNNIYWMDKDLRGAGCNENTLKSLGLKSIDEFIGISYEKMAELSGCSLEEAINFKLKDREIIKTGIAKLNMEEKLSVAEGKFVYFITSRVPLFDRQGNVIGVLGISADITKQKQVEKELKISKEKAEIASQAIIAAMPNNVFWWGTDGGALGCNNNTLKFLGLDSIDEFIGMTYEEASRLAGWTGGQAKSFKEDDLQVIRTGVPILSKEEPPISDIYGNLFYYVTSRVPLFDKQNNVIGTLGISTDISDRKRSEQELKIAKEKAEEANQAKTEFLENMRHDIRTPLTGIVGCAHLIQSRINDPEKVARYAEDLIQSSDALSQFLNKVLESIQVATGEIPLLKKKFNLQRILEQVIFLNQSRATVKNLELILEYDKNIPVYLLGDPVRVQRIILELLTNALKFTDKGAIKVTANLMKNNVYPERVIIKLRVCDTGMGIPHNKQNEVYTRFKRLTPSYQGIYPGTGLGLSIVKQFIDDLDGEIHIDSEFKQGSTFTCLIPFQESLLNDENDIDIEQLKAFETKNTISKKLIDEPYADEVSIFNGGRVLVVEDQEIAAKVAQGVLSELNCQVDIAPDGKTALESIEKQDYDLILMDVGLPDNDGCEVTRRIRLQQWQRNPSLPIVGLTAHIAAEKKQSCIAHGMNAVYTKPLTKKRALEILNAFIPYQQQHASEASLSEATDFSPEFPILDKGCALELLGSEELLEQAFVLLEESLVKEIELLKQYYQKKGWSAIQALAHKWKGGATYCGAKRLEYVCQRIEAVLQAGSFEEAEGLYQQLLQVAGVTKDADKRIGAAK